MQIKKFNSISLLISLLISSMAFARSYPKIVYDIDNRVEVKDFYDQKFRNFAKSVAGQVASYELFLDPQTGEYNFNKFTLSSALMLCPGERFASQYTLPDCTGFLVAPDVLVTAGHCVESNIDCRLSNWVFDYVEGTTSIKKENIFKCKKILSQEYSSSWFKLKDYAVIQLDRAVQSFRKPLDFRKKKKGVRKRVKVGTDLVVIGHPTGLPLKIADGGKVKPFNFKELLTPIRSAIRKSNYFLTNLDTFAGNSGSPVFNQETGQVEGILIEGATDYTHDEDRGCEVPARRSGVTWTSAEKAFRITKVKNLKKIVKDSYKRNQ